MAENNKNENDKIVTEPSETDKKAFSEFMGRFCGWIDGCNACTHKPVCSIFAKEGMKKREDCEHYQYKVTTRYGDIYEMFEPIFKWMEVNYPSDDIHFLVERNMAKLFFGHGPQIASKTLMPNFNYPLGKKENENG